MGCRLQRLYGGHLCQSPEAIVLKRIYNALAMSRLDGIGMGYVMGAGVGSSVFQRLSIDFSFVFERGNTYSEDF